MLCDKCFKDPRHFGMWIPKKIIEFKLNNLQKNKQLKYVSIKVAYYIENTHV